MESYKADIIIMKMMTIMKVMTMTKMNIYIVSNDLYSNIKQHFLIIYFPLLISSYSLI